ncbi:hypothetical protein MMPV_005381 [Pyropia vietnamensis]
MRRVTTKWGGDRHGAAQRHGRAAASAGVAARDGGGRHSAGATATSRDAPAGCWRGLRALPHPPGKAVDAQDVVVDVLRDDGRPYGSGDSGSVDDDPAAKRWDTAAACAPWVVVEDLRLVCPSRVADAAAAARGSSSGSRGGGGGGDSGTKDGRRTEANVTADWTTLNHLHCFITMAEEERWLYGDKDLPSHKLQALEDWLPVNLTFATLQRVSTFLLTSSTAPTAAVDQRIRVLAEATVLRASLEADVDSSATSAGSQEKKKKKGFKGFSLPGKKHKPSSATAANEDTVTPAAMSPGRSRMNWEVASSEGAAFRRRAAGASGGTTKMTTAELLAEKRSMEETLARFDAQLAALATSGGDDHGDMADLLLPARHELDERLRGLNAQLVAGGTVTNVKAGEAIVPPISTDIIHGSCSSATVGGVEMVRTSPLVSSPVSAQVDSDGSEGGSVDTSISADEADCAQALRSVISLGYDGPFSSGLMASPATTYTSEDFDSDDDSSSSRSGGSNSDGGMDRDLSVHHQRRLAADVSRSPSSLRGAGSDLEFVIDLGDRRRDSSCVGRSRQYAQHGVRQRAAATELCVDDGDPSSDLDEQALASRHRRHWR